MARAFSYTAYTFEFADFLLHVDRVGHKTVGQWIYGVVKSVCCAQSSAGNRVHVLCRFTDCCRTLVWEFEPCWCFDCKFWACCWSLYCNNCCGGYCAGVRHHWSIYMHQVLITNFIVFVVCLMMISLYSINNKWQTQILCRPRTIPTLDTIIKTQLLKKTK